MEVSIMADKDKTKTSAAKNKSENTSSGTPSHKYEEQSKTVTDKKGNTTTVKVSQYSDEELISTTVTTNKTNKNKTQESHQTESSIKTYDPNRGYSEQTTTFSHNNTYDKKHNITKEVREERTSYTAESGALAKGLGKYGSKHYEKAETNITVLDKKGNITQTEYHLTNTATKLRVDSKTKYTQKEKDGLKNEIRVSVIGAEKRISDISKNQKFAASLVQNTEHYTINKGNKSLIVGVDSTGKLYGDKTTKKGDDQYVTKQLSQNKLKKELKAARKKADDCVKAVTEAKTVQELTASIPSPMNIGAPMNLGDLFNTPINQEVYNQTKKDLAKDYKERQAQDKQPIAQIIEKKMQNCH